MHIPSVLNILGNLLLVLGGAMLLPLGVAFGIDDGDRALEKYEVLAFFISVAAAIIVGGTLRTVFNLELERVGNREGAATVTFTWLGFSLIGCLPYIITGAAGFTDAYYETISGFTTTGASVFSNMEALPSGLMFWRCQTQWMGGMGIVVLSVAILPLLGMGGYRMFKAEVPGGATFQRDAPRIRDTAKVLWAFYIVISAAEAGLLRLAGMSWYDAVCHTFTTMSTGGYSTSSVSVAGWPSPAVQWVIIAFMFIAGVNFGVYQQIILGRQLRKPLQDPEFKLYALLALLLTALVFSIVRAAGSIDGGTEAELRGAAFQVVSISTTTGYGTEDFDRWPDVLRLVMVMLMFVGGCAGSTAGGMKLQRWMIFFKATVVELRRTINPRGVLVVRIGDRPLEKEVVANIMSFLAMFLMLWGAATFLLTLMGMDLVSGATAAVSNLGNIGPGLGTVGPAANYADVPTPGKWILIFCQILGRLELYSVMVLFYPRTWVR